MIRRAARTVLIALAAHAIGGTAVLVVIGPGLEESWQSAAWHAHLATLFVWLGLLAYLGMRDRSYNLQDSASERPASYVGKIKIRELEPLTDVSMERKRALRDEIKKRHDSKDLDRIGRSYSHGERIRLDICFYLYKEEKDTGGHRKDIDNLLKIPLDVLSEHMDNSDSPEKGVGLIPGNRDELVYELYAEKVHVADPKEAGFDVRFFRI